MDALARAPTYEYTTLNEIVGHLEERQVSQSSGAFRPRQYYPNIYLVALECSTVHQCRGDRYCSLKVIDPSCAENPELQHGVEFRCFIPPGNPGPCLDKPGDILRLHRVKAELFAGRLSLSGRAGSLTGGGPSRTPCSFCLFSGRERPYQSSHTNPSLSEAEQPIVEELRQWRARVDTHTVSKTEYSRIIRDIRPGEFFDLVCLILAVAPQGDAATGADIVYVWDSTDAMPFPPRHYATEFETGEDRSPRQTYWPQRETPHQAKPCADWSLGAPVVATPVDADRPLDTLRTLRVGPAPARYRVRAQVVEFCPREPTAMWQRGTEEEGLAPALRLLLRDGTGTLEATLAGSDALLFLFGSPRLCEAPASPGQPAAPSQLGSDLTPLLDRLTGACSTTECGVWSVMNLQAFVRADGARRYRITDTRLTAQ
ncbi:Protection of telomeres protein 1 [Auxenochlorella protothecoides]|uniref:Protection of telomeres protein 1 n=1 Tax=Auxenochlorella protothecoides TaxID=3075 RepID=A0A087SI92_AUXPR|nr:Protection of telomeres protein 1 [Auxenochlorella protothecoides]KFM25446.1 Protection of telomeres protein 1 [Auxenochlorella protothecoides]